SSINHYYDYQYCDHLSDAQLNFLLLRAAKSYLRRLSARAVRPRCFVDCVSQAALDQSGRPILGISNDRWGFFLVAWLIENGKCNFASRADSLCASNDRYAN